MGEVVAFRIAMLEQRLESLRNEQTELRRSLKYSKADGSVQRMLVLRKEIAAVKDETRMLRSLRD